MTITNGVKNKTLMPGVTPIADVVDAPTIGTATAGVESATVAFTAAATGGAATTFTAISTPGSITGSSATSPITVSGLTAETSYTFQVYGANASGTWSAVTSATSNSITTLKSSSYESIATATGNGSGTTVTFSSIPGTFRHLQIRFWARGTTGAGALALTFNNDVSGTNYSRSHLAGSGSVAFVGGDMNTAQIYTGYHNGTSITNTGAVGIIDIHDYADTTKFKTVTSFNGYSNNQNTNEDVRLNSGTWRNTNAITSIRLAGTDPFTTTTVFALYGIKGS